MYKLTRPFGFYSRHPWREIEQLQQEMNRLFDNTFNVERRPVASGYPAINVWTNENGAVVTAELPGVNPDDLEIAVTGETVTLSGSRQAEELKEGEKYHRRERRFGQFNRAFHLPFKVEAGQVEAVFEKGILHVSLPRAEAEKPKKIAIKNQ